MWSISFRNYSWSKIKVIFNWLFNLSLNWMDSPNYSSLLTCKCAVIYLCRINLYGILSGEICHPINHKFRLIHFLLLHTAFFSHLILSRLDMGLEVQLISPAWAPDSVWVKGGCGPDFTPKTCWLYQCNELAGLRSAFCQSTAGSEYTGKKMVLWIYMIQRCHT